uniref:CB1 cannabinoid receptor-interacting protein 1 n=1 Tax=Panagrolaimus sp. JU765 TaxID=591449 RepID=A0AC34RBU1_9BILA
MVLGGFRISSFQLVISIRDAEKNDPIAFKQDGNRFGTSPRTIKFCSESKYRITLKTTPVVEFHNLHVGGSDLELRCDRPQSGEYEALWNTVGFEPTKNAERTDLDVILRGPGGTLKWTLQAKFYAKSNSHAEWGQKLDFIQLSCSVDPTGNITVTEEQVR